MIKPLILRFASSLRFPTLFLLSGGLFLIDMLIPDFIPFYDEILLALLTLALGAWKKRGSETAAGTAASANPD
jgi:hypothetical protein